MTSKEAMKELSELTDINGRKPEAIVIAIGALEKQIPIKPVIREEEERIHTLNNCNDFKLMKRVAHCAKCGFRIGFGHGYCGG